LTAQVAQNTGIPLENYIDSEKLIKMDNTNTMYDQIHPNEHGYGVLAQELYMRLALSPTLKKRVDMIYE
jgi:lysophospholipase L1-like esterase